MEKFIQQQVLLPRDIVQYSMVAPGNDPRPGLAGVFVNLEKRELLVTDGFMFWATPMTEKYESKWIVPEEQEGDIGKGFLFRTDDLRKLGRDVKKRVNNRILLTFCREDEEYVVSAQVVNMPTMEQVTEPVDLYRGGDPVSQTYPDLQNMVDSSVEGDPVYRVAMGYEVLERVAAAMKATGQAGAVFEFRGHHELVVLRSMDRGSSGKLFYGGMMPMFMHGRDQEG